jgi:hypothetical protein
MRLISNEEFNSESWNNRGGSTEVFKRIAALKVGEILEIEEKEWDKNYSLSTITRYLKKRYGREYSVHRHISQKSWAVKRLK